MSRSIRDSVIFQADFPELGICYNYAVRSNTHWGVVKQDGEVWAPSNDKTPM